MILSSILGGAATCKATTLTGSSFYSDYRYQVANLSMLEASAAIGFARRAERPFFRRRVELLNAAARSFRYSTPLIEHTVRMTGMPYRVIESLLEQIPEWLQAVPHSLAHRFGGQLDEVPILSEGLLPGRYKILTPLEGYCYVAAPGNDPRASALAVANLAAVGLPFILRASIKDAVAPLLIEALLDAGFDPGFCGLVYFDPSEPDAAQKQFKLIDAASVVWTFGPPERVDATLRYEESTPGERIDHFEGKRIVRHESGNCAILTEGPSLLEQADLLIESLRFPLGCTAAHALLAIAPPPDAATTFAARLAALQIGDPLDPTTEVGYISPKTLDYLDTLVRRNRLRANFFGGERISSMQARPLLVQTQTDLTDFLTQEIPAYVLTYHACASPHEAAALLHRVTQGPPRLSISLIGLQPENRRALFPGLPAHSILFNEPTTHITPYFHEGNDYAHLLLQEKHLLLGAFGL